MNPQIIGLTGSFGSGCSYIADNILVPKEYVKLSLSDILRQNFQEEKGVDPNTAPRNVLQDFGDEIREKKGESYLAEKTWEIIAKNPEQKYVIDSIRNPSEIFLFRRNSRNFFLFGVYADVNIRWERSKIAYDNDRKVFDEHDENDTGGDNESFGQRVGDCFYEADIVFENNEPYAEIGNEDFQAFSGQIDQYVKLVSNPLDRQKPIRQEESLMAMAYAIGQRSSCMKRKVGAVIVDSHGNIISSGFNEVPPNEKPCEKKHKCCYRDKVCNDFFEHLKTKIPDVGIQESELKVDFKKRFKNLDYCRSLHAEENAIVNLARNGSAVTLDKCTIYSTTYPCRMCANKIVQAGIKKVIYVEPYPDPEAKLIFKRDGVVDEFFRGVTYKAFFRLYGDER